MEPKQAAHLQPRQLALAAVRLLNSRVQHALRGAPDVRAGAVSLVRDGAPAVSSVSSRQCAPFRARAWKGMQGAARQRAATCGRCAEVRWGQPTLTQRFTGARSQAPEVAELRRRTHLDEGHNRVVRHVQLSVAEGDGGGRAGAGSHAGRERRSDSPAHNGRAALQHHRGTCERAVRPGLPAARRPPFLFFMRGARPDSLRFARTAAGSVPCTQAPPQRVRQDETRGRSGLAPARRACLATAPAHQRDALRQRGHRLSEGDVRG